MLFSLFLTGVSALQTLPPVQWTGCTTRAFNLEPRVVYIDESFAGRRDQNGLTLIPPSAYDFAETFRRDLEDVTGDRWKLELTRKNPEHVKGIFFGAFRGHSQELTYENGAPTKEAYELEIGARNVFIGGTGARGMFWGTRTLLQQILLAKDSQLECGRTVDAPAYSTRGYMIDAGRKWYSPKFLKDLCTYASFFKMSEFQYHTSDNYPLNRGRNETWYEIYSQWSLRPEDEELQDLVQRPNETLSRAEFEDFQQHCAARGITVIPEIEAPAHALSITKWKPELALTRWDLLNLTHPDTIPTVKSIWAEYLPWFETKEVHIGADEYPAEHGDDYVRFVNTLADFVYKESGGTKRVRIWGTPVDSNLTINENVIVQHWQYGQSDPVALRRAGHKVINSEDWWAYMSLKNDHMPILPAPYPQFFNTTRILNFANKPGRQWQPALFNPVNVTEQLQPDDKGNKGAILAAWSDSGPDATTQLEGYYAIRRGIALVGARAWSGLRGVEVDPSSIDASIDLLAAKAPGQNLDRRLGSKTLTWSRPHRAAPEKSFKLGWGSKGMDYQLDIRATDQFTLAGPDTTLSLTQNGSLFFTTDGWTYPLRSVSPNDGFDPGHPGRIWTNQTSSTHEEMKVVTPAHIMVTADARNGSRVWVDGEFAGRFEVFVYGGRNTLFSWSQMALVAPLDEVSGGVQELTMKDVS